MIHLIYCHIYWKWQTGYESELTWLSLNWLTDWLAGWLTACLPDWLTDSLNHWLIDLSDQQNNWLSYWLTNWLTDWLAVELTDPQSRSLSEQMITLMVDYWTYWWIDFCEFDCISIFVLKLTSSKPFGILICSWAHLSANSSKLSATWRGTFVTSTSSIWHN